MNLGATALFPLFKDVFLNARLGYSTLGATLVRLEQTTVTGNVPGEFEHRLESDISIINFEQLGAYRLFKNFSFQAGLSMGYVLKTNFHQRETIISPGNGTFLNEQARYRNDSSGEIPDANNLAAGIVAGISYSLPLNASRTLFLAPELFGTYALTDFVNGLTWNGHSVRLGASLYYSPAATPTDVLPPVEIPPATPTPTPKPPIATLPVLSAELTAVGVDTSGVEVPNVTLRVEEFLSTRMQPLLPYIFFDEASAVLPERYSLLKNNETNSFTIDDLLRSETLPTYYHLLNIVGRRMTENPAATIRIVGCNDNGAEKSDLNLSQKRAEIIRNYLVSVWNIPSGRMTIETRNLPENPSNIAEPDGIEENRRVEIYSDEWEILKPVITNDTLRQANPPVLRIRSKATAEAGLANWKINIEQSSGLLKEFSGENTIRPVIDWSIGHAQNKPVQNSQPLEVSLSVSDAKAQSFTTQKVSVPVDFISLQTKRRERIADKEIDRFSLILFDFDKSTLGTANQRIANIIKPYIRPMSSLTITGHTDRMGDALYNQQLSKSRAQASAAALQTKNVQINGVGEENLLFDNTLPEGRFYSRTVNIVIETPVGK